ncbi:MAG: hypothetical protein AB8B96_17415 [Lysobacterales bacterium]
MPLKKSLVLIIVGLATVVTAVPVAWSQSESLPADEQIAGKQPAGDKPATGSLADESNQTRQDLSYVRDATEQAKNEQAQLAEKLAALQARLAKLEAELEASRETADEAGDPE